MCLLEKCGNYSFGYRTRAILRKKVPLNSPLRQKCYAKNVPIKGPAEKHGYYVQKELRKKFCFSSSLQKSAPKYSKDRFHPHLII